MSYEEGNGESSAALEQAVGSPAWLLVETYLFVSLFASRRKRRRKMKTLMKLYLGRW